MHDYNQKRINQNLPALTVDVPDWTTSGFGVGQLGQLELDTIRGFNGYGSGTGNYARILREFDIQQDANGGLLVIQVANTSSGNVVRFQVPGTSSARGSSGDPAYVSNVLAKSPTCP